MTYLELLAAIVGSAAFTTFINYVFTVRKMSADADTAKINTDKAALDLDEQFIEYKNMQITELLAEVKSLRREVASLKMLIQSKENIECHEINCANRKTKKQQ